MQSKILFDIKISPTLRWAGRSEIVVKTSATDSCTKNNEIATTKTLLLKNQPTFLRHKTSLHKKGGWRS